MQKCFMKYSLFALLCVAMVACNSKKAEVKTEENDSGTLVNGKKNPYVNLDQSPMDMSYFPVDYPIRKMNKDVIEPPVARVLYSRPHKKGRTIFSADSSSLCPYGAEWRLGANEATEIDFYRAVNIGGNNIPAGRYVMYSIPKEDSWIIALNTNLDTWGLHMDTSKDVMRIQIPTMEQKPIVEDFTMMFVPATDGATLLMAWDNVKAELPIKFM